MVYPYKPRPLPDMPVVKDGCITGNYSWDETSKENLAEQGVDELGRCDTCNDQYNCPFGGQGGDAGWKD